MNDSPQLEVELYVCSVCGPVDLADYDDPVYCTGDHDERHPRRRCERKLFREVWREDSPPTEGEAILPASGNPEADH